MFLFEINQHYTTQNKLFFKPHKMPNAQRKTEVKPT